MDFHNYDIILINSSGGKDSQTMLRYIVEEADAQAYPRAKLIVAHADLGEMEWEGTKELAATQAAYYGLRFEAISRPQGNLLTHVEDRGMWPSSTTRYCTSEHKRGQIGKIITQLHREWDGRWAVMPPDPLHPKKRPFRMLNCFGFRSQESPARKKKLAFQKNERASTQTRTVDDWLPIQDWTEDQVWASIKSSGVPYHYAYDLGMPRLSCIFCVFAPRKALILAGKNNRELLDRYVAVEEKIGHTFTQKMSIASVRDTVDAQEEIGDLDETWNM